MAMSEHHRLRKGEAKYSTVERILRTLNFWNEDSDDEMKEAPNMTHKDLTLIAQEMREKGIMTNMAAREFILRKEIQEQGEENYFEERKERKTSNLLFDKNNNFLTEATSKLAESKPLYENNSFIITEKLRKLSSLNLDIETLQEESHFNDEIYCLEKELDETYGKEEKDSITQTDCLQEDNSKKGNNDTFKCYLKTATGSFKLFVFRREECEEKSLIKSSQTTSYKCRLKSANGTFTLFKCNI